MGRELVIRKSIRYSLVVYFFEFTLCRLGRGWLGWLFCVKRGIWWVVESYGMKDGSEFCFEMFKVVVSSRAEGGRFGI